MLFYYSYIVLPVISVKVGGISARQFYLTELQNHIVCGHGECLDVRYMKF
jgi:hypothetical protein